MRKNILITTLGALLVIFVFLAFWGQKNTSELETMAQNALARQLSAQAQLIYASGDSRQITSVLLAIQSIRMLPVTTDAAHILQNNTLARPVFSMIHEGAVTSVAFSPDTLSSTGGKYAVSGSTDKTVRVWDVATGREVSHMIHDGVITSVAFSADGKLVASGSIDKTARVWEVGTGKEIARMTHNDLVTVVAFSPDGKYVASGSSHLYPLMGIYPIVMANAFVAGDARVWETATGKEVAHITQSGGVLSLAFSPDGKYLVTGSINDSAQVWVAATGKVVASMSHGEPVNAVAVSQDGKYVISGSGEMRKSAGYQIEGNTARVWETATGKEVAHMTQREPVISVAFSPDNKYVASGSVDGIAMVWDASTGKEVARMRHDDAVLSIAFSPDTPSGTGGKYVVSGGKDKTARVWEAATGKEIARMTHDGAVNAVVFHPGGKHVVSGSEDKAARIWETVANTDVARVTHTGSVSSLAFSPDGKYLVSGGLSYDVKNSASTQVWEIATGKEVLHKNGGITCVAFSPNGKYVATCSWAPSAWAAHVWEIATGKELSHITYHTGDVAFIAFTPDGNNVVAGGSRDVQVWEASTGRGIARMKAEDAIYSWEAGALSPDGKYVTAVSSVNDNPVVFVWEVATGSEVARMSYDGYNLRSLAFSPNGQYIVAATFGVSPAGSWVPIVQVWETATGKEVVHMISEGDVYGLAFSPNGKHIVSGGGKPPAGHSLLSNKKAAAQIWDVATWKGLAHVDCDGYVPSVAFSPNSQYVISGCTDGTARVWEAATGKEIARATYKNSDKDYHQIGPVGFSVDGKYAVSSGCEQLDERDQFCVRSTVRVWLYQPEDLAAQACAHLTRNLTLAEWQEYIGDALPYQAVCPNLPIEP